MRARTKHDRRQRERAGGQAFDKDALPSWSRRWLYSCRRKICRISSLVRRSLEQATTQRPVESPERGHRRTGPPSCPEPNAGGVEPRARRPGGHGPEPDANAGSEGQPAFEGKDEARELIKNEGDGNSIPTRAVLFLANSEISFLSLLVFACSPFAYLAASCDAKLPRLHFLSRAAQPSWVSALFPSPVRTRSLSRSRLLRVSPRRGLFHFPICPFLNFPLALLVLDSLVRCSFIICLSPLSICTFSLRCSGCLCVEDRR